MTDLLSLSGEWKSREDAECAARRHLAEIGGDEQEETSEILVHPDDQAWFRDWARSQKVSLAKYRRLLEAGWTQDEAFPILWGFQPDPARIQQLGDPLQLIKEIERQFKPE